GSKAVRSYAVNAGQKLKCTNIKRTLGSSYLCLCAKVFFANRKFFCKPVPINMQTKISFAVVAVLACALVRVSGEPSFTVTDLGTLGGNTSTANSVAGNGANAAGMIVGSSTIADNSEHAFLFVEDKMYDLNTLCDLS